jgi:hypothetical protein
MHRADGDRRVGQIIKAGREPATHRVGGRAWLNGREVGGAHPRYMQLEASRE